MFENTHRNCLFFSVTDARVGSADSCSCPLTGGGPLWARSRIHHSANEQTVSVGKQVRVCVYSREVAYSVCVCVSGELSVIPDQPQINTSPFIAFTPTTIIFNSCALGDKYRWLFNLINNLLIAQYINTQMSNVANKLLIFKLQNVRHSWRFPNQSCQTKKTNDRQKNHSMLDI